MWRHDAGASTEGPLVGRGEELDPVLTALEDARGGRGRLVLIEGEAGVGKTRLLRSLEFEGRAERRPGALGRRLRLGPAALRAVGPGARAALTNAGPDRLPDRCRASAADVTRLLGARAAPAVTPPASATEGLVGLRLRFFDCVTALLRAASTDTPLVLALDDLDTADEGNLKLLLHVAVGLPSHALLVTATCREDQIPNSPRLNRLIASLPRRGRHLALCGLDAEEVAVLLEHGGARSGLELAQRVNDLTDSNPFFVQIVARLLASRPDGKSTAQFVPHEVHGAVRLCLDRLPPAARRGLRRAAVLGTTFDAADLSLMASDAGVPATGMLGEAEAWGLLSKDAEIERVVDELSCASPEAAERGLPSLAWWVAVRCGAPALLEGRFAEAEDRADEARALAERAGVSSVDGVVTAQLIAARCETGRFVEVVEAAGRVARAPAGGTPFEAAAILALARSGVTDTARAQLARMINHHPGWRELASPVLLAEVSWELHDGRWAATLHNALGPYKERHVVFEYGSASLGSSDRHLVLVAALLGRPDESQVRFEAGHAFHTPLRAVAWLPHGQEDHARALRRGACSGDPTRVTELAQAARDGYQGLGMAFYADRAGELLPTAARATVGPEQRAVFRKEGEFWTIGYDGRTLRLHDGKGLRYLARLLADPGREFHALDLVTGGGVPGRSAPRDQGLVRTTGGDAGAVLDERAKAAYRRRLADLRDELDDATGGNDLPRAEHAERAERELDFLVAELSAAVGLGGRGRKAASDPERARQNVTRALRSTIERIAATAAALGAHLKASVHTGTYCRYEPDPRARIVWEL